MLYYVDYYGAVADADAEGDVDPIAEAAASEAVFEDDDNGFSCPRISPFVFWSVCTLKYALPSCISLIRSDTCFPDSGPFKSAEVIVPPIELEVIALPPLPDEADAEAPAKALLLLPPPIFFRSATIGPFVPTLPLWI